MEISRRTFETTKVTRRSFLKVAAAIGASLVWVGPARGSRVHWQERRDLYPQGVASGDPDPHSVILWTRRPFAQGTRQLLTVEVAEDEAFRRVIAHAQAPVSSAADWTTRVRTGIGLPTTTETAAGSAERSRRRRPTMRAR
jgi:alkaline phosphatase D